MIEVSKLNGEKYFVNAEAIDFIETTPDTVLTLASGKKLLVLESPSVIIKRIVAYKQKIYLNLPGTLAEMLHEQSAEADRENAE
ncbi:MAG TPA: endoflagellar protein [Clostridiales bacterium]|nr:endoflagellar protein [Clostridiales bacterium]